MTKAELFAALADAPDDTQINIWLNGTFLQASIYKNLSARASWFRPTDNPADDDCSIEIIVPLPHKWRRDAIEQTQFLRSATVMVAFMICIITLALSPLICGCLSAK